MATYLLNILPTKTLANKSPTHILYNKDPSYTHLRTFGCLCYPLFPSTNINKLQARFTPCVFLGYPSNNRGYNCFDLSANKIITSCHVVFDESQYPFSKLHSPSIITYDFLNDDISPYLIHHLQNQSNTPNIKFTACRICPELNKPALSSYFYSIQPGTIATNHS